MKTRSLTNLGLAVAMLGLPLAVGCAQSGATNAEPTLTSAPPATVTSTAENSVLAPAVATASPTNSLPAARTEPVLPPIVPPDSSLAEVIKLAQSGVEESVIHTFVANSTRPFALGAEQIVYLNDIGVSGQLITAMMQHDQGLKSLPPAPLPPTPAPAAPPVAATAAEPVAEAPSYVEAPSAAPAQVEAQPTYVSNNYFYDSLAPYGCWIEVEGYGRCWQPTVVVVNRNWQPYCHRGRWVYSDAGWYWLSDYSWGATTFHYGRWFSHPSWGWCWRPDTVWAPSWVSWRYNSGYCGWAPLPPNACYQPGFGFSFNGSAVDFGFSFGLGASAYTFVPWGSFCAARPYQYRVPYHHATQIYNSSTVINNYGNGNNNTVVNRGISPDRVREYTGTEVRPVTLRDGSSGGRPSGRREQLTPDGRTLVVQRPTLAPVADRGESLARNAKQTTSPGAREGTLATPPPGSVDLSAGRNGRGGERSRTIENVAIAPASRTGPVVAPSPTVTRTPVPSPARVETLPGGEPQQRAVRPNSSAVVRPPVAAAPSATAPASRSIATPPRTTQASPQTTARPSSTAPSSSLVVIGGKSSASRSGGRDYSVWSTSTPAPSANASAGPTRPAPSQQSAPAPVASSPRVAEVAPAPTASRGAASTFSTPALITPSYTPRPAPASPALNTSRVEPRSAPVLPAKAPSAPQSAPASVPGQRGR